MTALTLHHLPRLKLLPHSSVSRGPSLYLHGKTNDSISFRNIICVRCPLNTNGKSTRSEEQD
uniref:Uncharacterized protein n=1 Tax=Anguilla anguilla TaxID=7936 RepID=A0A0E9TZM9_ANGAN